MIPQTSTCMVLSDPLLSMAAVEHAILLTLPWSRWLSKQTPTCEWRG